MKPTWWIVLAALVALGGTALWLTFDGAPEEMTETIVSGTSSDAASSETRPLKLLMVELGQDMSRINDGIWHMDREMIVAGARAIAEHPKIDPQQMQRLKEALGNRFSGFVQLDQAVHDTSAELARRAPDMGLTEIVRSYHELQQGCVACHTGYRDAVREALD